MPETTTTTPKCRACIEQGIPGECTDPAHQVAPDIGDLPPLPPKWSDPGYLARAAEQHQATAAPEQPPAHQPGRTCQEPEGRDVPDLVRRVHDRVTEQRIPAFPGREPQEWHVHAEHAYSGDCAWCRHDHEIARLALVQAIIEAADGERVTEPPTDLRDALETALSRERAKYGHLYLGNAVNAVLAVVQAHVTAEVERARAEGAAEALKVVADHIEQVWKEADQPFREHELRAAATVGYLRQEGPLILAKYADRIAGGEQRG